jgi:hypothetical protein
MFNYRVNPKQLFAAKPRATSDPQEQYLAFKKIEEKPGALLLAERNQR